MASSKCFGEICFVPLEMTGQKFFGFSEFLAGLALMVLAWTLADVRYKFRVKAAPIPLMPITFAAVSITGALTLLTDLWRAQQLPVPDGSFISPGAWQALLGGLFLLNFLIWAWVAFIHPPIFSKKNARNYSLTLYNFILKGSAAELPIIADELTSSAQSIIKIATVNKRNFHINARNGEVSLPQSEEYANDLLMLIADKRFCKIIVESSPATALAFFQAISNQKKYLVGIEIFSKNFMHAAIANKESFLYSESDIYQSGLLGHHKPLSYALFYNYTMVESVGTLLNLDFSNGMNMDATQWKAYYRTVNLALAGYMEKNFANKSFTLLEALNNAEYAVSDLSTLDDSKDLWKNDAYQRLRVTIEFIVDFIDILSEKNPPPHIDIRNSKTLHPGERTVYDYVASLIFEVIHSSASIGYNCQHRNHIQYSTILVQIFSRPNAKKGWRIIRYKVRRLIYDEIRLMRPMPNYKGAKMINFCLNTMGLVFSKSQFHLDINSLHRVTLNWLVKNYVWLHSFNLKLAESCLPENMHYDDFEYRLVHIKPENLMRNVHITDLHLNAS